MGVCSLAMEYGAALDVVMVYCAGFCGIRGCYCRQKKRWMELGETSRANEQTFSSGKSTCIFGRASAEGRIE